MTKTETQTYQRLTRQKQQPQKKSTHTYTKSDAITGILAFLLARSTILGGISPFGVAFFAASYKRERAWIPLICAVLGTLSIGLGAATLKYVLAMLLFAAYKTVIGKNQPCGTVQDCVAAGGCLCITATISLIISSSPPPDMIIAIFESLICAFMAALFKEVVPLVERRSFKGGLCTEQIIAITCVAGVIMAGMQGILRVGSLSVNVVLCVCAILIAAYKSGAGNAAALGVAAGLICGAVATGPAGAIAAARTGVLQAMGMLAFCGFVAGCMRPMGKFCVGAGFAAAGLIMTFFGGALGAGGIFSLYMGVAIFLIMPKRTYKSIGSDIGGGCGGKSAHAKRVQELLFLRLDTVSESFASLSATLDNLSARRGKSYDSDIMRLFSDAAERVCRSCSVCIHCWDKDIEGTQTALMRLPDKLEKKGYIDVLDVPEQFRKRCVRIDLLVDAINRLYDVHHINVMWSAEVDQARDLLSRQYMGFASVLDNVKNEVSSDVSFESKSEARVEAALIRLNIYPARVSVFETLTGRIEVEIEAANAQDERRIAEKENDIALAVSEALGQPMRVVGRPCGGDFSSSGDSGYGGKRKICLEQQFNFSITRGVATLTKKGQLQSGDRYMTMNMPDNRYVMAISDGMGSGSDAAAESGIAISIIDRLLRAGFDSTATANLVNSALVIKAGAESFATIDMALINLMSGTVEFVKIGSAASYIKRGGKVEKILCTTLPAGIFAAVDMEMYTRRLCAEDVVVMMSDGVADAAGGDDWVCEYLSELDSTDPEEIAELLVKEAVISKRGKVDDDMTVVAARICA